MHLRRHPDGSMTLGDLPPLVVDTLLRMPAWLRDDDPRVRDRLLPEAYTDPEEQASWERLVGTELEHLLRGRTEVVEGDLRTLGRQRPDGVPGGDDDDDDEATPGAPLFELEIGAGHEHAWLASLNGARLALFARHGLGPDDMERDPEDFDEPEKGLANLRIQVMAYLQELLIAAMSGGADLSGPPDGAGE